uniref:(California timema) hypothetical protein n=1 Tax=Timema californicum TaxID=61474 RepID=A0A7R9J984_TIMCA|nr:unnamed protein product [Timema californicum]
MYCVGFFTYLYGASILFLLYVFCFLLQESSCCAAGSIEHTPAPASSKKKKDKDKKKQKEKEKEEKKAVAAQAARNKGTVLQQKEMYPRKMKDLVKLRLQMEQNGGRPIIGAKGVLRNLRSSKDVNLNDGGGDSPTQEKLTGSCGGQDSVELESGTTRGCRKRKTSQNIHSHGSFFLRVGAIEFCNHNVFVTAFGLGTMIYNGLECGAFFEIPFNSPCYQILRGINPVLQMIFTFMQMYFIFMNSRLNIHRFKVLARFGLMHIVATNLCVWIRTLVLESLKEITAYQTKKFGELFGDETLQLENMRLPPSHESLNTAAPTHFPTTTSPTTTTSTMAATTTAAMRLTTRAVKHATVAMSRLTTTLATSLPTTVTSPSTSSSTTTPSTPFTTPATTTTTTTTTTFPPFPNLFDSKDFAKVPNETFTFFDSLSPEALISNTTTVVCERVNIMGSIVQDSAPYLFPFIIEYSLIGAAVIYTRPGVVTAPRYVTEEDLEHRLEVMLSRRAVAMAHAQQGRVDCVGASKGLFFGLLLLVGSLICLILFFVLIHHPDLGLLAIYLADVSHCVLMALSIIAIIIGFIRVQNLKFRAEEQSDLNDILLRVSAFGLFVYAVFSVIAGSLAAFTHEPNLLVMVTGLLSVFQVVLQLLFIADVSRRRVHLPEHDRSKPGRQVVTFLLICNVTMWVIYTFETQKVGANPVQLDFYGFLAWAIVQRVTLPLCIFHRFHSAVTLAEIWKTSYKARLE